MDVSDLISFAIGVSGFVTAVVAILVSHKSNKLAESANSIAQKALAVGKGSNELAAQANEISEHANLIAQRALDAGNDQTVHQWAAWLDAKASALTILNDCASDARDVHVVVRHEDETIADRHVDFLPAFEQISLEDGFFAEKLREEFDGLRRSGVIGSAYVKLDIYIAWTSELGVRRACDAQQGFGYAKRKKILS